MKLIPALPKYFFQEMCFSGGKQTMKKVSAAFIVKNCHPRTPLKIQKIKTDSQGITLYNVCAVPWGIS